MPSKNPAQRLRDIVDNIDTFGLFVGQKDRDDFGADRKTLYAVVRASRSSPKPHCACRRS